MYSGPAQLVDGRLTHPDTDVLLRLQLQSDCCCCANCNYSICADDTRCPALGCDLLDYEAAEVSDD
jgi:hypothetical protein